MSAVDESNRNPRVILRSWPKMFFLWPTALLSLVMTILNYLMPGEDVRDIWGGIFLLAFAVNMLVLTFDFPRTTSLLAVAISITVVLLLMLLNQTFAIIPFISNFIHARDIYASTEFYLFFFIINVILFAAMSIAVRFDYWEVTGNELIHHHGLWGDLERFSTTGLKFNKEIADMFEYILARSGRVILLSPMMRHPVILSNVLNIDSVIRRADKVLDASTVRVEPVYQGSPIIEQHSASGPVDN